MFSANNLEQYFEDLEKKSWTLIPINTDWARALRQTAELHDQQQKFKVAEISQSKTHSLSIRNDRTYWLASESNDLLEIERQTLLALASLQHSLKDFFRISLQEYECHYAIYEPGHYYKRHTDTTTKNNRRFFSFIIYLNPEWTDRDGGQLRAYSETDHNTILFSALPLSGQMILFRSHIEHEVLPTNSPRYSLTGWMRT